MAKIQLALNVVQNLRSLADSIEALVNETSGPEVEHETVQVEEKVETNVSFTDVRELCGKLANDGYSAQIKELLDKYGVKKLSQLEERFFDRFMREAEVIPYNAT